MICDTLNPALIVLMILLAAAIAPVIGRVAGARAGWLLAVFPLAGFAYLLAAAAPVWGGATWRGTIAWAPELGIDWDLWVSPLGLLLGLLVTGIGTLVTIYAGGYLAKDPAGVAFSRFCSSSWGRCLG